MQKNEPIFKLSSHIGKPHIWKRIFALFLIHRLSFCSNKKLIICTSFFTNAPNAKIITAGTRKALLSGLMLFLPLMWLVGLQAQDTYTWDGGIGNWIDNNWTCVGGGCGTSPGAGDNVVINSGAVTLDVVRAINDFTLGADLQGSGSLTVNGSMTWNSGGITVNTTVNGTLDITTTSIKSISGAAVLTLNGTTNHSEGTLYFGSTASLVNTSGATYNLSGTGRWYPSSGTPTFTNEGTVDVSKDGIIVQSPAFNGTFTNATDGVFNFTGGTGTHTFGRPFTNDGTINYSSGSKLDFNSTFVNNNTVNLHSGATLETAICTINSALNIAAGESWNIKSVTNLNVSQTVEGTLTMNDNIQGTGPLTANGGMAWNSGGITINTTVNGTLDITTTSIKSIGAAAVLTLNGTTNHSEGTLYFGSTASLINTSGATYNLSGTGDWYPTSGTPTFTNEGTVDVSKDGEIVRAPSNYGTFTNAVGGVFNFTGGAGTHTFSRPFTNNGAINYNVGSKLDFNSTFDHNGSLSLNGSSIIEMRGGTVAATASWNGGTGLRMTGGTGNFNLSPPTSWSVEFINGTSNLNAAFSLNGMVTISGTVVTTTLQGSGPLTANGGMIWNGGSITVSTTVNGTLDIITTSNKALSGTAVLTLNGTTNHSAGTFHLGGMASLINTSGATYNLSGTGEWYPNSGTPIFTNEGTVDVSRDGVIVVGLLNHGTFTNAAGGVFNFTGGAGTHIIDRPFTNNGTINYNFGSKLHFSYIFVNNKTVNLHSGATLETFICTVNSTLTIAAGESWNITGITDLNVPEVVQGTLTVNSDIQGTGPLTANGGMTWNSGGITINTTVNSTLNIATISNKALSGTAVLTLNGTTNHSAGTLYFGSTASLINASGATYNLSATGDWYPTSGSPTFTNEGTVDVSRDGEIVRGPSVYGTFTNAASGVFNFIGGTGVYTFSRPFANNGTVTGEGTLDFNSTFTQNGTLSPGISIGTLTIDHAATILGSTSVLEIKVSGMASDLQTFTNTVTLGGHLDVTGINCSMNETFTIITCAGSNCINGTFATTSLPAYATLNYLPEAVELVVNDQVPPTMICQGITVQLDASGNASITASQVDNGSFDNCSGVSLTATPLTFTCSETGANSVTLTGTDSNSNSDDCTVPVTVEDNVAPTATCQSMTAQLDASGNTTITGADIDNGSSDACGIASLSASPNTFSCTDVGANTVTLTVTDNNGNTNTCTATVTVEDNVAPTATCQSMTAQLDASGNTTITGADIDNGSSDACGIASLSASPNTFSCTDVGANTVTLTVTDNNGNTNTCTASVTVEDNVAPTVTCQNQTVALDASGNATLMAADVDNGSSDACGIASMDVSPNSFTCFELGANTVTLNVTDNNGNSNTCNATVTVTGDAPQDFYQDSDSDGYGNAAVSLQACIAPNGYVADDSDCDDSDGGVSPAATETCNGIDDDCDGVVDEDCNPCSNGAPIASITEGSLPDFCQGLATLTANDDNPIPPLSYAWSSGLGSSQTVTVHSNGTYSVTVTNGNGCEDIASITVDVTAHEVLSGYVLIADEKLEAIQSTVNGGGVGVLENSGEAKLSDQSTVNTFVKANNVEVTGGSSAAQVIQQPAGISLPPFKNNPSNSNNHITVQENQTMTLTGSSYGKIKVEKNATLFFDNPEIFLKSITTEEGAMIDFLQPSEVKVKGAMKLDKENDFNPSGTAVVVYLKQKLEVKEYSNVTGAIYAKKNIETKGQSTAEPTTMTGLFISLNEVKSDKWTNWNRGEACFQQPPPVNLVRPNVPTSGAIAIQRSLKVFPNPANDLVNINLPVLEGNGTLTVTDQMGRTVLTSQLDINQSTLQVNLHDSIFGNGIYYITVLSEGERMTERFVVIK